MKKILTTLAITGLTVAAFAQGTVSWTGVAGNYIAQTNSTAYSSLYGGGATGSGSIGATTGSANTLFYYELLTSASLNTPPTAVSGAGSLSSWLDTGLEAQNGAGSNGRILQLNSGTAVVANNWPIGAVQNLIMVGWSANLGTTWATALGNLQNWAAAQATIVGPAYFGIGSSVGSLASNPGNPGVTVFGTGAGQINNGASAPNQLFLLPVSAVPEPGTMALAGLGGLSLLAFRRKK